MNIYLEEESLDTLEIEKEKIARQVIEGAIDFVHCPYECEVNLLLTDNEGIQIMNREYRGLDCPTDVLSFPMVEYRLPAEFTDIEEQDDIFDPDSGELLLGDIVISKEKVAEQAREYGHSQEREFAFLIAHSMLHLFGYDHLQDEERAVMEEKQTLILKKLGINR